MTKDDLKILYRNWNDNTYRVGEYSSLRDLINKCLDDDPEKRP